MRRSWESIIEPALTLLRPTAIVEIGSSRGDNTRKLLQFCRETGAVLHAVDPLPAFDVEEWTREFGERFVMHRARSLAAIPEIGPADAYLIDGDHNWYTVYHELKLIGRVADEHDVPFPLVLLHDVGWPYGRRDLYYDPTDIPEASRQPFSQQAIAPGDSGFSRGGLNADLNNAVREHGPRNGVLTAVEDFLNERPAPPELITLHGFHGMGILVSAEIKERRPELATLLRQTAECHRTLATHLQNLEAARIRNLMRVDRLKRRQEGKTEGGTGSGRSPRRRSAGDVTALPTDANPAPDPDRSMSAPPARADIIVCVHNALDDVRRCLASVVRHTDTRHRLILVDDGSEPETRDALADFAADHADTLVLRNERGTGFTRAANRGLRESDAELAVLLNSDTIVTAGWLEGLLECAASSDAIGLVGPLTNRGAHQSIPKLPYRNPGPKGNPLPPGWTADEVARVVVAASVRAFPQVPLLDGFCLGMKRSLIEAIGLLDEKAFPQGYGETYDYCFRAVAAGFTLAVADHVYIFHAGARSYSEERRRLLGDETGEILRRRWGKPRFKEAREFFWNEPALGAIRAAVEAALAGPVPAGVAAGGKQSGGVVGMEQGERVGIQRHAESWIEPGSLGTRFPPYRPTFGEREFVSEGQAALSQVPMLGDLIETEITGWLRKADALKLYELAYRGEGDILEIGCAHGLSTSIMAGALRDAGRPGRITSVDLHEGRMGDAKRNLAGRGLADRVEFVLGDATAMCKELATAGRRFGFAFVDHSHAYQPVLEVCQTMPSLLTDGGFVLIHDFNDARNDDPANWRYGVLQAVQDGLPGDQFMFYGIYGCTALFRKVDESRSGDGTE